MTFLIGMAGVVMRFMVMGMDAHPALLIFIPLWLALIVVGVNNQIKRLHDIGRSGWWLLATIAVASAIVLAARLGVGDSAGLLADVVVNVVALGAFIVVGCIHGEPHANRFGPIPGAGDSDFT